MARIALFIIALGALAWVASSMLGTGITASSAEAPPTRQLDNVRGAANRIEQQGMQRAEDALQRGQ
jgi:hypothetical protein